MVQILPQNNQWADVFRNFGQGVSQGYMNRADQMAIQKAVSNLEKNASMRDVLNAVAQANTYGNEAKQKAIENYTKSYGIDLQERKFEEEKRATQALEGYRKEALEVQRGKANKNDKLAERMHAVRGGLQTVKEMRAIGAKGNLGWGTGLRKIYSAEAAQDAGQYEQLGKSLIQLSTTIPIRNRQEFETLAHKLYDPSLRDAEREGVLGALESILERSLLDEEIEEVKKDAAPAKVRVRNKETGKTGSVTPYEGMEAKYDILK